MACAVGDRRHGGLRCQAATTSPPPPRAGRKGGATPRRRAKRHRAGEGPSAGPGGRTGCLARGQATTTAGVAARAPRLRDRPSRRTGVAESVGPRCPRRGRSPRALEKALSARKILSEKSPKASRMGLSTSPRQRPEAVGRRTGHSVVDQLECVDRQHLVTSPISCSTKRDGPSRIAPHLKLARAPNRPPICGPTHPGPNKRRRTSRARRTRGTGAGGPGTKGAGPHSLVPLRSTLEGPS
jgi:hypothetical protein